MFERDPGNIAVANLLATNLMQVENPAEADQVLTRSIEAGNQSVETLKLYTRVKLKLGQLQQAEKLAQILGEVRATEVGPVPVRW